jgi:peroxiredoxin
VTSNAIREDLEQAFQNLRAMDAPFEEQLSALSASMRQNWPDFAEAIDRMVARLRRNGVGASAPELGEAMPSFHLPDQEGHIVSLERLLANGPVAVMFHRGHWCSYCRVSVNALTRAQTEIGKGQIVLIMPDRQQFLSDLKSAGQVPFPILTDLDNGYAMSLNLVFGVDPELQAMMRGRELDLPSFQGNQAWMLPIPATFVVGRDGIIKARFIDPDYRNRMAISDLVAALQD